MALLLTACSVSGSHGRMACKAPKALVGTAEVSWLLWLGGAV